MDVVEKGAVEAMLHLSRPAVQNFLPSQPRLPPLPSLPPLSKLQDFSPSTYVDDNRQCDQTSGSSISPRHSPLRNPRDVSPNPESSRPLAMRLSQLLTANSNPLPPLNSSPVRLTPLPSCAAPPPLPLPPLKLAMQTAGMLLTEPLTPPFSPPVLPPLSSMTGLAPGHNAPLPTQGTETRNMASPWSGMAAGMTAGITSANRTLNANSNALQQVPASMSAGRITHQGLPNTSTRFPTHHMMGLLGTNYSVPGAITCTTHCTNSGGISKSRAKRPYKKYYSNPTPSSHCHVCARTSKAVKFAVCARIAEGLCRKVTCYKCFLKFGWDWESAAGSSEWVCVHCRGVCPEGRSQCFIYSRVNSKRESKRGAKKKKALEVAAAAAAAAASATVRKVQMMGNMNASMTTSPGISETNQDRQPPVSGMYGSKEGTGQRVW